jgi:hypothetical protein
VGSGHESFGLSCGENGAAKSRRPVPHGEKMRYEIKVQKNLKKFLSLCLYVCFLCMRFIEPKRDYSVFFFSLMSA